MKWSDFARQCSPDSSSIDQVMGNQHVRRPTTVKFSYGDRVKLSNSVEASIMYPHVYSKYGTVVNIKNANKLKGHFYVKWDCGRTVVVNADYLVRVKRGINGNVLKISSTVLNYFVRSEDPDFLIKKSSNELWKLDEKTGRLTRCFNPDGSPITEST